ncbi:MAG: 3',5'-cyclic adenosine monophosphate phosphodiesterase CpdA [Myxococcota bacterium]|nr:3',5'-cyclic adenosine monophosphate phosphodiesterase CpdA [Myxococcota bacterium]
MAGPIVAPRISFPAIATGETAWLTWNERQDPGARKVKAVQPAAEFEASCQQVPGQQEWVCKSVLTGFSPGKTVSVTIEPPGETVTFDTPPAPGPCASFRFAIGGDGRSSNGRGPSTNWFSMIREIRDHNPKFMVNTGDLVEDGAKYEQWKQWLDDGDGIMTALPILPVMGNHDDGPKGDHHFVRVFTMPWGEKDGTKNAWTMEYGSALFLGVDSQEGPFEAQAAWMEEVLSKSKARWKFAFYHHPSYTSEFAIGSHEPNEKNQNRVLTPLFDKHGLHAVFSGHNHFYERFQPSRGSVTGEINPDPSGVMYVISGGAGSPTNPLASKCKAKGSVLCSGKNHYVLADVTPQKITFSVISSKEQTWSKGEQPQEVIDKFEITNNSPVDCGPPPDPGPGPDASTTSDTGDIPVPRDAGVTAPPTTTPPDTGPGATAPPAAEPPAAGEGGEPAAGGGANQTPPAGTAEGSQPRTEGCGCAVAPGGGRGYGLSWLLAALLIWRRRRILQNQ